MNSNKILLNILLLPKKSLSIPAFPIVMKSLQTNIEVSAIKPVIYKNATLTFELLSAWRAPPNQNYYRIYSWAHTATKMNLLFPG